MNGKDTEKVLTPPRKKGGKKKGANSFVKVRFVDLKDYISEQIPMTISRVWLESLGFCIEPASSNPLKECEGALIQTSEEEEVKEPEPKVDFKILTSEEEE